jgi:hypothetical protein
MRLFQMGKPHRSFAESQRPAAVENSVEEFRTPPADQPQLCDLYR